MNWDSMDYEEIARHIRNEGIYTGNMVDRLCAIIEENQRQLQELEAINDNLVYDIQDFRQWVTSMQGEISELTEGNK